MLYEMYVLSVILLHCGLWGYFCFSVSWITWFHCYIYIYNIKWHDFSNLVLYFSLKLFSFKSWQQNALIYAAMVNFSVFEEQRFKCHHSSFFFSLLSFKVFMFTFYRKFVRRTYTGPGPANLEYSDPPHWQLLSPLYRSGDLKSHGFLSSSPRGDRTDKVGFF